MTKTSSPQSCIVSVWFLQGTRWSRAPSALKFYRHESRWALAHIRQRVGVASRQPFDIAGLESSRHRAHSFDVAAQIEIGNRDHQMRTVVMVAGYDSARFKVDFRHAHSIFHEENFAAAARKSLFATLLRPTRRHLPQFFILHQLNRHVAKGLVRRIPCDVGKVSWHKPGLTVAELEIPRRLTFDVVSDVSIAECDEDVVVAMAMHEGRSMGRDLNLEDANGFVFKEKMVRGFGRDLDFRRCLGGQERNQQKEEQCALHGIPRIQAEYTILPPTIVATTFPVSRHPSKGVFFDFECDLAASKVHFFFGSKTVTSVIDSASAVSSPGMPNAARSNSISFSWAA